MPDRIRSHPDDFEKRDGWQKHMAKKAAGMERKRFNGRLFCVRLKRGSWRDWTPYRRPLSMEEAAKRVTGRMAR